MRSLLEVEDAVKMEINAGDWVSISRSYAKGHGLWCLKGKYRILSKTVFARQVFTNGDSLSECGYDSG